jgi:hypothetical protein
VENVLGSASLMQGNKQNTIWDALLYEVPGGAAADSKPNSTCSLLFEVNIWMWCYGRAFLRKISVDEAKEMLRARVSESRPSGAETLKRRCLAAAAREQE